MRMSHGRQCRPRFSRPAEKGRPLPPKRRRRDLPPTGADAVICSTAGAVASADVTIDSRPAYEWGSVVGEVVVVLLGAWVISRGWTAFGWILLITGVIGLVASSTRLWRVLRER